MKSKLFKDRFTYRMTEGFSLIEILLTISIMAILFAIMMPNLLSSRRRAHDTSTMHYLRAVAIKQADYYIDNSTYAATESQITDLVTNANMIVESWQGDSSDFCVQAKHPRGISYKITAESRVLVGNCV